MTQSAVKSVIRILFLVVVAVAVQGCRGQASPTTPSDLSSPIAPENWVSITSISPSAGTSLEPGATVMFDVTVRYGLGTQDAGGLTLVVQDVVNRPLQQPGEQPTVGVSRGHGETRLSTTAHLLDRSVVLHVLLFPNGEGTTTAFERVVFPLSRN
jgi:hypothetical protein